MESLELYFELDNFFLVHAGFNFKHDDPFEDEHSMLWIRDFKPDPTKIGEKTVVHGHVPVSLELIYHLKENTFLKYIDIDNGVYMKERTGYGNLVALELNSMDIVVQHNLDM